MSYKTILIAFVVSAVIFSCSSQKTDYEDVQKLQDASEQVMQHSTDYDVRLKACNDMTNSLQAFLTKHPEGEWSNIARTALLSWESRRDALVEEKAALLNQLNAKLQAKAEEEAHKVHSMCNIERMTVYSHDETKEGSQIVVKTTYAVRMRGAILGMDIFKINVTVSGRIATDTKEVSVDQRVTVVE